MAANMLGPTSQGLLDPYYGRPFHAFLHGVAALTHEPVLTANPAEGAVALPAATGGREYRILALHVSAGAAIADFAITDGTNTVYKLAIPQGSGVIPFPLPGLRVGADKAVKINHTIATTLDVHLFGVLVPAE